MIIVQYPPFKFNTTSYNRFLFLGPMTLLRTINVDFFSRMFCVVIGHFKNFSKKIRYFGDAIAYTLLLLAD